MGRLRIRVDGVVQGVGFRPFVYRLARARGLGGWVLNRPEGVLLEVEGPDADLDGFRTALTVEAPAPARIRALTWEPLPETGERTFAIRESEAGGLARPSVPPDLATCPDCLRELADPADRRYQYPFINCTYCGPRFTLIAALPYDRPLTSMKDFPLCPACAREYEDPLDRRFHAQPVACPVCGPRVVLLDPAGAPLGGLAEAARLLAAGGILALKGLGGFQLLVDAASAAAVAALRRRKHREEKPFAVLYPSLEAAAADTRIGPAEAALLASPQAPIVLVEKREAPGVAEGVAPGNPRLGVFLATTPLHRLLLDRVGRPLVCTSGNLSDEPMAIAEAEALDRLGGIADAFLVHDRPILRPVDDSVVRLDPHGPTLLRRARGYAPQAHPVPGGDPPVLALGAHQKNTLCLLDRGQALVSQHLGDLHTAEGAALLARTAEDLLAFFRVEPARVACDLHPDYASSRLAERLSAQWGVPLVRVQHHHAHVAAVAAEAGLAGPLGGLAWDGAGLGPDGTIWGGEALRLAGTGFTRAAWLRPFPLPGGDRAAREPARAALGLLWAVRGDLEAGQGWVAPEAAEVIRGALASRLNTPLTSSVGRLFDAVAAMTGIRAHRGYEGQAAMALEYAALRSSDTGTYPWAFRDRDGLEADPGPLVEALLADRARGLAPEACARRFHQALADLALAMAERTGCRQVVLSGGCFQNALLTALVRARLAAAGLEPVSPTAFPPHDGGLSLGQAYLAGQG
ncbi:carbamoyltransferase HypF [Mesoterricola sediminis]|uniref:Carbamoyltransferase n=1 Tax=Mesoterricola sediminis TaxID=2927980 RepID=A0AA48KDZ1_9BACT|nr:carbamoyltransferase HypF [Mesoterricola sediminis]BDU76822.1 carbamoyltransferase HypF [Mesoterricola sediminis]